MAKTRRKYKGNATPATISAGLSAGATSATISANTGWPTSGPFYCVVDPGTSSEEKILVGSISGTTISSITRGVDDTSDTNHASGCTIYPVFTAVDADEANELTATYSAQGHLVYQGASTFTGLAIGTAGQVLKVNSGATAPEWGQVATASIADDAVTSAKIATDAVGSSEIAANAVGIAELATAVQNFLVPVGTIAMYGGATAPTGWLLCDGSSFNGTTYSSLNTVLGGTTLPDLRGRFPIGDNSTLTLLGTGGSTTIGVNNLPSHSHANTAVLNSGTVTITDPGHSHTVNGQYALTGLDYVGAILEGGAGGGSYGEATATATTGITGTVGTGITVTNANTGGGEAYYQPYLVVNYIIKHD